MSAEVNPLFFATILLLLVGSVVAGIVFASPLRKRFTGENSDPGTQLSAVEPTRQFMPSSAPMVQYAPPSDSYAQPDYRVAERQSHAPSAPQAQHWPYTQPAPARFAPPKQLQPQPHAQPLLQGQPPLPNFAPTYPPEPVQQPTYTQQSPMQQPLYPQPSPPPGHQPAHTYGPQDIQSQPMPQQPMPQQSVPERPAPQYRQPAPQNRPGSWSSSSTESGPKWRDLPPRS